VINIANNGSNSARATLSLGATNGRIIKLKNSTITPIDGGGSLRSKIIKPNVQKVLNCAKLKLNAQSVNSNPSSRQNSGNSRKSGNRINSNSSS
jgi:hypothetical protein